LCQDSENPIAGACPLEVGQVVRRHRDDRTVGLDVLEDDVV
jgi:hypothetical protein